MSRQQPTTEYVVSPSPLKEQDPSHDIQAPAMSSGIVNEEVNDPQGSSQ